MRLYCVSDCSVDLQPYHEGQVLDVSDAQADLLQRAAPSSFSTEDPAKAQEPAAAEPDLEDDEDKALTAPPKDKQVKRPERQK